MLPLSHRITSTVNYMFAAWIVHLSYYLFRFDKSRSWTLAKAKQNLVKYYSVVGIVEDMDSFFYALEKRMPRFFKGAFGLFGRYGELLILAPSVLIKSMSC